MGVISISGFDDVLEGVDLQLGEMVGASDVDRGLFFCCGAFTFFAMVGEIW
jgi:hypothetical protein